MIQVPIRAFSCMWRAARPPWSTLWELGAVTKRKPLVALKLELTAPLECWQQQKVHSNRVLSYLSFLPHSFVPSSSNFYHAPLSSFFFVSPPSLLDLVRPFLDLVRPHAVFVFFVFVPSEDPISKSTDIEFDLHPSPWPPNSSSPSLSIPPELFQFWPSMQEHHGIFMACNKGPYRTFLKWGFLKCASYLETMTSKYNWGSF